MAFCSVALTTHQSLQTETYLSVLCVQSLAPRPRGGCRRRVNEDLVAGWRTDVAWKLKHQAWYGYCDLRSNSYTAIMAKSFPQKGRRDTPLFYTGYGDRPGDSEGSASKLQIIKLNGNEFKSFYKRSRTSEGSLTQVRESSNEVVECRRRLYKRCSVSVQLDLPTQSTVKPRFQLDDWFGNVYQRL